MLFVTGVFVKENLAIFPVKKALRHSGPRPGIRKRQSPAQIWPSGKMASMPSSRGFPGFRGTLPAPLPGFDKLTHQATRLWRAPPIPAAIEYATIVSTGSFRKKTPRASLLAPIPAVLGSAKISRQPMHLHKDTVTLNCYATFARTCYECGFRVCLIYSTA